jgi:hypothetical protein
MDVIFTIDAIDGIYRFAMDLPRKQNPPFECCILIVPF